MGLGSTRLTPFKMLESLPGQCAASFAHQDQGRDRWASKDCIVAHEVWFCTEATVNDSS